MRKIVRRVAVALVAAVMVMMVMTAAAPSPASAQTLVGGNVLTTSGRCGNQHVTYQLSSGNYGNPQQVRIYTRIHGGPTYVTPWTTAARAGTVGFLVGERVPRGRYVAHYVEYREYNYAYLAQYPSRGGWYVGGEWVVKGAGYWCLA